LISFVAGTRPELIKLKPLFLSLREEGCDVSLIFTGQHADLSRSHISEFTPCEFLDVAPRQTIELSRFTGELILKLSSVLERMKPKMTVVQGDTVSAFAGAYVSYMLGFPVAHV